MLCPDCPRLSAYNTMEPKPRDRCCMMQDTDFSEIEARVLAQTGMDVDLKRAAFSEFYGPIKSDILRPYTFKPSPMTEQPFVERKVNVQRVAKDRAKNKAARKARRKSRW